MNYKLSILLIFLVAALFFSCDTGLEPSPDPGTIRVILQSDPADSSIVVNEDVFYVSDRDSFRTTVFQGKIFTGDDWAILYQNKQQERQEDHHYNILKRENNTYKSYTIFETFLPPDNYDNLQFGISASYLLLTYGFAVGGISVFMELPPEADPLINLPVDIEIKSNQVTEIYLTIKPFESVSRYRDIYYFTPVISVQN